MKAYIPFILLVLVCSYSHGIEISKVESRSGLTCSVHLRGVSGKKLPLVIFMAGTGKYSMISDEEIPPFLRPVLGEESAALLTIDKPGVSWKNEKVEVEDSEHSKYTQIDLLDCVEGALKWAISRPEVDPGAAIFLVGHSEGAHVMARLLEKLNSQSSSPKVRMTLLSGLPLQKWTDIVKSQLKGKRQKQFFSALKSKNSDALYKLLGLGYSYFQDADGNFLKQVLVKLRDEKFSGSIQAFQGLNDKNVSSQQVIKFENENNLAFDKGQPALRFSARYYNSGHSLGGIAANDIAVLLMTYLSP